MNKAEFINYEADKIHEIIADRYDEDISIKHITVVKMNDKKLNGLTFSLDEGNVCPTVYLDNAFEAYMAGKNPDIIADEIAEIVQGAKEYTPPSSDYFENGELDDKHIALRLLEASRNIEFLKNVPYRSVGNGLVLVCDVRLQRHGEGYYSTIVNNEILKMMGKDDKAAFDQAFEDAWDKDGPILCSIESKLFGEKKINLLDNSESVEPGMYILSNTSGIHGAAALFYPGVQEKISEVLGDEYYALPSSTEEFIIVPQSMGIEPEKLTEMLHHANKSVVEPEQILSDIVMKYDKETGTLKDVTAGKKLHIEAS